ncbi:hypothetical protein MMB19_13000 [Ralstonia insidiosa]|nr:hypothetical protein MMB19_13000 [Ralstonia insidiosa]
MRAVEPALIALLASLLATPAALAKDMSDAELKAVGSSWKRRCADLAAAEAQPTLEKRCYDGFLRGLKEVDDLRTDNTISEQMWDTCKAESGFNYTGISTLGQPACA